MPKFMAKFTRTVEQFALHEIEAESREAADEIADRIQYDGDGETVNLDWRTSEDYGNEYSVVQTDPPLPPVVKPPLDPSNPFYGITARLKQ